MGKSKQVDGDNNLTSSSETDPAKLLEAALLQMDGIIAEAGGGNITSLGNSSSSTGRSARARALELAQQLASSLQHAVPPPPRPDFTTASAILRWLQQNNNSVQLNDADDRVRRLEADKESLQLQVQVLSEQISAQSDKMNDLERALHDARQRLDDAEQRLQKEMLQRSSLETQKLELLSKLSEMRLRVAERGMLERSPPPPEIFSITRPPPPRTPPANYGRQIERNNHMYSSLPRSGMASPEARLAFGKHNNMVVAGGRGQSVPNLAEKEEVLARGSPSPSLREVRTRLGSGGSPRIEGGELARGPLRATAQPRLQRDRPAVMPWQTTDIKQWDCETTCGWLESLGLETYIPTVRSWLQSTPDVRGVIAAATPQAIEKELGIKHPMHRKKIVLAVTDLLGGHGDPYLSSAGQLDTPWVLRWLEDVGMCPARAAAAAAAMDGRCLHRLTHHDMYSHLKLHQALHALSIRRGIQVLRDNNFSPDTMIRRALDGAVSNGDGIPSSEITRWSTHRVMQWLNEIDLAEYAPNLRGSGVHGGLMLLEARFTAELLAALLNIPANKTLLRRHLTQRFNDLLGRDVIQQKRIAEQTLGYQPLTATTKYKVPKKSQFTLKRKKSKDEADFTDLVCPLTEDCSGDLCTTPRKTILYWIRRNEETGGDLTPHHRQLYQRATTANEDGAIVAAHTANPFRSTALTAADYNVTTQTIRRRLNAAGIKCRKPAVKIELTPQHAEARVGFCLEYYNFDWVNNTVIFVDEKCFKSSKDGKKILYRRDNERYEVPNVLKNRSRGRLSLGYWGWMSIALML